jgi:uncharacterized protein YndB with AHSA1/START domain
MTELILAEARSSIFIAADPDRVFAAWLDPATASRFLGAGATSVGGIELDAREGGDFSIEMVDEKGSYAHHGQYLVIDRPRRLAFTWISAGTEHRLTVVDIRFVAEQGGTRVDLRHDGLLGQGRADRHSGGWQSILEKLGALLG